jgi:hypothetical protein
LAGSDEDMYAKILRSCSHRRSRLGHPGGAEMVLAVERGD